MALREDSENGQPKVYWVTHGGSLLRCSPDQIRPLVERIGEPKRPANLQAAQATLQGLRRGGIAQFFDISQLPGPTIEDEDMDPGPPEPEPAPNGASSLGSDLSTRPSSEVRTCSREPCVPHERDAHLALPRSCPRWPPSGSARKSAELERQLAEARQQRLVALCLAICRGAVACRPPWSGLGFKQNVHVWGPRE